MEAPSQRKRRVEVRKVQGMRVLRGPRQESEMRGGRKRPGRLDAFCLYLLTKGEDGKRLGGHGRGWGWEGLKGREGMEETYHQDKKVGSIRGGKMQRLLRIGDDEVETKVYPPKGEEEPAHDEEVGHVGEGAPVHLRLCLPASRPFARDEVGGDESDEDDEGDDCSAVSACSCLQ